MFSGGKRRRFGTLDLGRRIVVQRWRLEDLCEAVPANQEKPRRQVVREAAPHPSASVRNPSASASPAIRRRPVNGELRTNQRRTRRRRTPARGSFRFSLRLSPCASRIGPWILDSLLIFSPLSKIYEIYIFGKLITCRNFLYA